MGQSAPLILDNLCSSFPTAPTRQNICWWKNNLISTSIIVSPMKQINEWLNSKSYVGEKQPNF